MNPQPAVRAPLFVEGGNAELQGLRLHPVAGETVGSESGGNLPADDALVAVVGNMRPMLKVESTKAPKPRAWKEISKTGAELLKITTKLEKPATPTKPRRTWSKKTGRRLPTYDHTETATVSGSSWRS